MADATFTTVVARVDAQLTNAIWEDQIRDNLNQLAGSHRQLLVNGGFEPICWQRGVGGFVSTVGGIFGPDRWVVRGAAGVLTVTQETSIIDTASGASAKAVTTGSGGEMFQLLEDFKQLRGRDVSLSVRVRQSVASQVTLEIQDSVAASISATSATTGSFVTLTVTRTMNAATTSASVWIKFAGAGTYYLDNAMLVIGPDPAPYQPLHPAEDLARCQRYYELHGAVASSFPAVVGVATAGAQVARQSLTFAVPKSGTPTLTKNGTWAVTNCGQPTVGGPTQNGYFIDIAATAGGQFSTNPNSSDDTVSIEHNP